MATAPAPYWPIVYVRGYAMTPTELAPALAAASASGPTVSSGACLR